MENNPQIENQNRQVRKDRGEAKHTCSWNGGLTVSASGGNHEMGGGRSELSKTQMASTEGVWILSCWPCSEPHEVAKYGMVKKKEDRI